jgi:hypothetical protein
MPRIEMGFGIRFNFISIDGVPDGKDIDSRIGIHPRVPRGIPIIWKAWSLNSTSRFPYLYWVGAAKAEETVNAARARTARFM